MDYFPNPKPRKRDKKHALDVYVAFSIGMLLLYTIVCIVLTCIFQVSLDTLTTCFFSFFGGEIVTCGLIKIFKLRGGSNDTE